jgi:phage gp36-like protein
MPYATASDLNTRFGSAEILQLADRDGSGVADAGVIEAALADADTEINGYLAVQYSLPLASTPALVVRLACDIARYRLWKDIASEQVRQGYEDAVDTLKRLAAGTVRLAVATGPVESSGGVISRGTPQVFTDRLMAGSVL